MLAAGTLKLNGVFVLGGVNTTDQFRLALACWIKLRRIRMAARRWTNWRLALPNACVLSADMKRLVGSVTSGKTTSKESPCAARSLSSKLLLSVEGVSIAGKSIRGQSCSCIACQALMLLDFHVPRWQTLRTNWFTPNGKQ